ncbi:MAG: glycosyltransferase, partial [bacterium]|jgi:glycosyltransferase involved in cell wall biosynthesis
MVAERVPDARFVFAGSPFTAEDHLFLDSIKRLVSELGLEEHVEFTGQADDVPGLMAGCDLVVLPSRREAVGRVVLEAGAMGKPVVASATGGLRQSVRDGDSGILVAPGDARGFADAIIRLLTDSDLAARMGRRGREIIASGYSSEETTRRIMAVYDEILPPPQRRIQEADSRKGSGTDSENSRIGT